MVMRSSWSALDDIDDSVLPIGTLAEDADDADLTAGAEVICFELPKSNAERTAGDVPT